MDIYGKIAFPSNAHVFLKELYNDNIFPIKYTRDEDGKIRFDEQGENAPIENMSYVGEKGDDCLIFEDEMLENDTSFKDFCVYAKLSKMSEIDFFRKAMPHELMHSLGFGGGIFEGQTENLTRQTAKKYNIPSFYFAHCDETKLMQQIEKIVGRDSLIKSTYLKDFDSVEDVKTLSNLIDENIGSTDEAFKRCAFLNEQFYNSRNEGKSKEEQRKIYSEFIEQRKKLEEDLDLFITSNQDKVHKLGEENKELSEGQIEKKMEAYDRILKMQDIEKEYLGLFVDCQVHEKQGENKQEDEIDISR